MVTSETPLDTPAIRFSSTFRALRHRNYRLFFIGQLISLIGTWMQNMARQWLVFRLTGSGEMMGMVSLVGALPVLLLSLWGGSLADRFSRRSIVLVAQMVMMVQAFILAALTWTNLVQVWHVMGLAILLGAANAVDLPARQAFVVDMVEGKEDLTSAIGLNSSIFNAGRALGPVVAGMAVATTGEAGAFFINGVTFIAVIIGLLLMRLPRSPHPVHRPEVGSHMIEGVRYVWGHQSVMVLMSLVAVSAFLSMPYNTLLPIFAKNVLNPSAQPLLELMCTGERSLFNCQQPDALTYGVLMFATGVGAVIGALFVASLPATARRGRWLTLGNLLFPALLVAMAWSRSFWLTLVLMAGIGISFVIQNALANTLIQITVPDELRGRVMSLYALTFQGMMRFGGLQAGALADRFGAPLVLGVEAAFCLMYGVFVAIRYPHLRETM